MTPAMLFALVSWREKDRKSHLAMIELPQAQIAYLQYNMNRSPGDATKGIPEAPFRALNDFRLFNVKKGSVTEGSKALGEHTLSGAKANKSQFTAWGKAKSSNVKVKTSPATKGRNR